MDIESSPCPQINGIEEEDPFENIKRENFINDD